MATKVLQKQFNIEAKVLGEGSRVVRFKISSEAVDRDGDIIRQEGLDFSNFALNPIILFNHNKNLALGTGGNWTREGDSTFMDVEFAPEGVSEFIDEKFKLVECGVLRAGSISFIPKDYGWIDVNGREVFEYKKCEVLEYSVCTIPCNPDSLAVERSLKDSIDKPSVIKDKSEKDKEFQEKFDNEQKELEEFLASVK